MDSNNILNDVVFLRRQGDIRCHTPVIQLKYDTKIKTY